MTDRHYEALLARSMLYKDERYTARYNIAFDRITDYIEENRRIEQECDALTQLLDEWEQARSLFVPSTEGGAACISASLNAKSPLVAALETLRKSREVGAIPNE